MDFIDKWLNRVSKNPSETSSEKPKKSEKNKGPQEVSEASADHTSNSGPKRRKNNGRRGGNSNRDNQNRSRGGSGKNQGKSQGVNQKGSKPRNSQKNSPKQAGKSKKPKKIEILKNQLKMIPLGGLDEVGKNMMALEYEDDIIIIDMGFEFPSEDMFGIDYVIPDISYLEERKDRIRGVVITHGHLDHIGGIPYMLPKLNFPPVYATRLTQGLIQKRLEEFNQEKDATQYVIDPDKKIKLGQFLISFFRVNHSIPDCVGVVIDTPIGKVVDTGDFKFDDNPARNQDPADIKKMEELGNQNVLALFCESTNALKPGHSLSEKEVGIALEKVISETPGRCIIASFSSQIGRIQQIIDAAVKTNRKVFVSGRSMRTNIEISAKLGYLSFPKGTVSDIRKYKNNTPDNETLIITTGSQGESVAALARMARNDHSHIKVQKGDTIVLSSSPIPGNEKAIHTVINQLTLLGAEVISNQLEDVHTSGHGYQDELARMINYIKPKFLVPIHGEFYMRTALAKLAKERCNITEDQIIMLQNGDVLLAQKGKAFKSKEKIETKYILIDGSGEGHVGSQVQFDRSIMSQNGVLVVLVYVNKKTKKLKRDPEVISRGFIYMTESNEIVQDIIKLAGNSYKKIIDKNPGANRRDIKKYIRQSVDSFTNKQLERRPLIVPLIIEQ